MYRTILFLTSLVVVGQSTLSQSIPKNLIWNETPDQRTKRLTWWVDARFGMFIHWGIYALPARNEWVKNEERLTDKEYQKYFDRFNPDMYNPRDWAKMAKNAGMKYAVITTKHHDGFCLFNSEYTNFNATKTPYGKDLLKEWVDAFRAEGLRIGFYYSLIDWHHPEFTIDSLHPQRVITKEEYDNLNRKRNMAIYREYQKNQVRELLTKYGQIDILWLDYQYPGRFGKDRNDFGSIELIKMVRELQPGIIVNDRAGLRDYSRDGWDFTTPEQLSVLSWPEKEGEKVPWETCQTISGKWGYTRDLNITNTKDCKQLLFLLIESVSKGGNLLLNVGPTGRGSFDYLTQESLEKIGNWMKYHSRSIYNCTQAPDSFEVPENSLLTYNPDTKRLYIHLLAYPVPTKGFRLPGYKGKVKYAQLLNDASELQMIPPYKHPGQGDKGLPVNDLYLRLPINKPNVEIPVIELILN